MTLHLVFNDEGDWMGAYKNGRLVRQGRGIEPTGLLQLAGVSHTVTDECGMRGDGHLPETLGEIRGFDA